MLILSCCRHLYTSHPPVACVVNVVRLSFPMMTITSSMMMMMMSCFVDSVGAEVANESNSGLYRSSTVGALVQAI